MSLDSKEYKLGRLFRAAEIAQFSPEQIEQYEESLKVYRDLINVVDTVK